MMKRFSRSGLCSGLCSAAVVGAAIALALSGVACAASSGEEAEAVGLRAETPLPARRGTVIVDGCVIDPWQLETLGRPSTKRVVTEVVMLCLVPREDGTVGPRDPSARASLKAQVTQLQKDGYHVFFGVAFTDESGQRYDGTQTRSFLSNPAWRTRFRETLITAAEPVEGVELELQKLPDDARGFVTALASELSQAMRPAKRLAVYVPPSVTVPSDLPGGEAFSRADLARYVDLMRVMTLDYSESRPGPTIEPGWAVDVARLALGDFSKVDISYPLYGTDFGPRGPRSVTYLEARALAALAGVGFERGPTGAAFLRYAAAGGEVHEVWVDDAESTARALGAWSYDVLPQSVGVVFYGLGAEDPALFERLAARMP